LDLPCGNMLFLHLLGKLYPEAILKGVDIKEPDQQEARAEYIKMDLTKELLLAPEEKFDLITSISGIMMFGNTLNFITNCAKRLSPGGTFIITNDNSATVLDKIYFFVFGRHRIFKPVYDDTETLTQNIPIQELCRLLRINRLEIEAIKFTSFYKRDIIFFPIAILIFPLQRLFLRRFKTQKLSHLVDLMYPFEHYFSKHYIIVTKKL
ncbi:MAG TPA: methyltransferase domain-containing protein, partial [Segetibacter sp.]